MEIEENQGQLIEQFVKQAATLKPTSIANLILEATSHPSLFGFSEILSVPNVFQLQGTENSAYYDLLCLFAYGTWRDYKSKVGLLPELVPAQVLKLKQLSVLTLAETKKVLFYDQLLEELEVSNVRELEDFLINECMYAGIVKGKLDQLRRCFEVKFAAGRDLRHGQLDSMIQTLTNWLDTSGNLFSTIQDKIKWADKMCELDKIHQKEVKDRLEEMKKASHFKKLHYRPNNHEFRVLEDLYNSDIDEPMDEEDRNRPKRRRSPRVYF